MEDGKDARMLYGDIVDLEEYTTDLARDAHGSLSCFISWEMETGRRGKMRMAWREAFSHQNRKIVAVGRERCSRSTAHASLQL